MLVRIADRIVNFVVLIFTMLLILYGVYAFWDTRQVYDAASAQKYKTYKPEKDDSVSFEQLQAQNPEVIGWLHVYGTKIDYPFTQAEDNSKYVNTDVMGEYALSGSLFLDCMNAPDFSNFNNIIYGHHMEKELMFGDLSHYEDETYFNTHEYGNLYYSGQDHGVHFFAFVKADAYDNMIYSVRIADQSEKSKYLSNVREQALYYRDLNISVEDENVRIIALSTCNSQTTNGRDVLIGVISDETYPDTFAEGETEKQQGIARNLLEQIPLWWYGLLESVLIGLEIVAILRYIRKKHKNCMAVNNRAVQGQKGGEINDKKPENGKYKK